MPQGIKGSGTPAVKRRPGRPPGSTKAKAATTTTVRKVRTPAPAEPVAVGRKAPVAASTPKLSKEDMRIQIEKLERTVATLRTRSRDAVRSAKQAAARIEELEEQLATTQKQVLKPKAAPAPAAKRTPKRAAAAAPDAKPTRSVHGRRLSAERDPGDAVPPGVTVRDPEPMDAEATAAFDSLEAQLHPADD